LKAKGKVQKAKGKNELEKDIGNGIHDFRAILPLGFFSEPYLAE
jgi:hypothetical protein